MTVDFDALLHRPLFEVFGIAATYTPPGGVAVAKPVFRPALLSRALIQSKLTTA
jgi:hypothetical protein